MTRRPREPRWLGPLLRRLLGPEPAREFREDLASARRDAAPHGPAHLWHARQLLRGDFVRLVLTLRARRRRAGPGASGPRPPRESASSAWRRDLAQALRSVRTGTALPLVCLTVGIGLCAAAFGAVHSVLLAPLPFPDHERLAIVTRELADGEIQTLTWLELDALRRDPAVAGAEAYTQRSYTLMGPDRSDRVSGASVTPGLFALLGVEPAMGRLFAEGEGAEAGFETVAVVSHRMWRDRLGSAPDVVGGVVRLNERSVEIVGVLPPGVRFPVDQELWLPLGTDVPDDRERRYLVGVARLAEGAAGQPGGGADLSARVAERLSAAGANEALEGDPVWTTRSLREVFTPEAARRFLPVMLGGVSLILLMACANVAGLLLVRFARRDREMALRMALGAGRGDLARTVVLETALLAAGGAVLGTALARGWLVLLDRRLPPGLPYWTELTLDPRAAWVVVGLAVLAVGLSAGPTLWRVRRAAPAAPGGGSRSVTRTGGRAGRVLAAGEVALGFVLLVSAGLLGRSVVERLTVDTGFDDTGLTAFRVFLSGDAYDVVAARAAFAEGVVTRMEESPSVAAAAWATALPGVPGATTRRVADGSEDPASSGALAVSADVVGASAGYLDLLGLRPLGGRLPTAEESADTAARVAVVGRTLAATLWPGRDALGRTLSVERLGVLTVVGVVDDVPYADPTDPDALVHQVHVPWAVLPSRAVALLARGTGGVVPDERLLHSAVAATDPLQAPYDLVGFAERRRVATAHHRLFATLAAEFGTAALLLALAGIYGVVAHEVAGRRREIGIRLALGAPRHRVLAQVLRGGALLAAVGVAAGLVLTWVAVPALRGLLFGVGAFDPWALGGTALLLAAAALAASLVPAASAARHDPAEVLDGE